MPLGLGAFSSPLSGGASFAAGVSQGKGCDSPRALLSIYLLFLFARARFGPSLSNELLGKLLFSGVVPACAQAPWGFQFNILLPSRSGFIHEAQPYLAGSCVLLACRLWLLASVLPCFALVLCRPLRVQADISQGFLILQPRVADLLRRTFP